MSPNTMRISGRATLKNYDWNLMAEVEPDSKRGFLVVISSTNRRATLDMKPEPRAFPTFEAALKHAAVVVGMDMALQLP